MEAENPQEGDWTTVQKRKRPQELTLKRKKESNSAGKRSTKNTQADTRPTPNVYPPSHKEAAYVNVRQDSETPRKKQFYISLAKRLKEAKCGAELIKPCGKNAAEVKFSSGEKANDFLSLSTKSLFVKGPKGLHT